jgi:hypothetical protein
VGSDGWRFGHVPTLKKVHADRKQSLDPDDVRRATVEIVKTVFKKDAEIHLSLFPKDSTEVLDQAMLTLAVTRPDEAFEQSEESELRQRITEWTRKCGQQSRQNPGGILWMTCEGSNSLRSGVEELLAWQTVGDDANRGVLGELEADDLRRIDRELKGAKTQIEDRVWSSYNHLLLWDSSTGKLRDIPLGQLHPSEARGITSAPTSPSTSTPTCSPLRRPRRSSNQPPIRLHHNHRAQPRRLRDRLTHFRVGSR